MFAKLRQRIADLREDRRPRLIGSLRYSSRWQNLLLGQSGTGEAFAYFYQAKNGRRKVKLSERGLRHRPEIVRYLAHGVLPLELETR